jgi:hypothetical protein
LVEQYLQREPYRLQHPGIAVDFLLKDYSAVQYLSSSRLPIMLAVDSATSTEQHWENRTFSDARKEKSTTISLAFC